MSDSDNHHSGTPDAVRGAVQPISEAIQDVGRLRSLDRRVPRTKIRGLAMTKSHPFRCSISMKAKSNGLPIDHVVLDALAARVRDMALERRGARPAARLLEHEVAVSRGTTT